MTPASPPWQHRDPAELDALLVDHQHDWWNAFYANRAKPVPFFVPAPDESLSAWITSGLIAPGRVLDLGCGNGRNAVLLARCGFSVQGIDYSREALAWAVQRAEEAGVSARIRFHNTSVFDAPLAAAGCDGVYDSGCFHHMPPHRRDGYIALVAAALKPGGWFGMACFRPEGGSGLTDDEVYERRTLGGGLGYTEAALREAWSGAFEIISLRPMHEHAAGGALFGKAFLWALLARKA